MATIAPSGHSQRLYSFMKELSQSYVPQERKDYLPKWPGFSAVFGLKVVGSDQPCHIKLDSELDRAIEASVTPHVLLSERLLRSVQLLEAHRHKFDVIFIYIPKSWEPGFEGADDEDFDLHDYLKAVCAARGIPIQLIREDSAISYFDRASVMWRVGLALYVKAGGVPWKLADTDPETAYIGISYGIRPITSDAPRFVTCCSQVFDAEGAGLEFVAYDAHDVEVQRDNPFLSRTEMFRVMTRSMSLYRGRHAGAVPRRVVVHKNTEFKLEEIDGCMEALHLCESVDLLQIVEDVGWRAAKIQGKNSPATYPVERGTLASLGAREALLWTHGDVKGIAPNNKSYFQGAKSTPRPIRLIRHAGHGRWDDTASATLALSKMDWNNDSLYDPLPVTMGYAKVLARVIKRMPRLGSTPYQFRFFM